MDRVTLAFALSLATVTTAARAEEGSPAAAVSPSTPPPLAPIAPAAPVAQGLAEPVPQNAPPGTLVIQPTAPPPGEGAHVVVEVDGQRIPQEWYGRPIPVVRGTREVSAHVYDDDGMTLLAPRSARYFVESGGVSEVRVPAVERSIDGAMLGGGIAVTTVATAASVWAGLSFVAASVSVQCVDEFGIASGCSNPTSTPWLVSGIASTIVGAGGTAVGIWMMVKGATPSVEWGDPDVAIGPDGVRVMFQF